jgi:hypothetical protein
MMVVPVGCRWYQLRLIVARPIYKFVSFSYFRLSKKYVKWPNVKLSVCRVSPSSLRPDVTAAAAVALQVGPSP